jgi:hypothetical protein
MRRFCSGVGVCCERLLPVELYCCFLGAPLLLGSYSSPDAPRLRFARVTITLRVRTLQLFLQVGVQDPVYNQDVRVVLLSAEEAVDQFPAGFRQEDVLTKREACVDRTGYRSRARLNQVCIELILPSVVQGQTTRWKNIPFGYPRTLLCSPLSYPWGRHTADNI